MKKALGFLALSSLILTACSGSGGDGKGGSGLGDGGVITLREYTEEKSLTEDEFYKELGSLRQASCNDRVFDQNLRGAVFKFEKSVGMPSVFSFMRANAAVESVSSNELKMNLQMEQYDVSMLPGQQIYVDNRATQLCKIEASQTGTKFSCDMEGKFTPAVEEYIRNHQSDSNSSRSCSRVGEGVKTKSFSKGVYVLQNGKKVPALKSIFTRTGLEKCNDEPARTVVSTDISVTSGAVLPYADETRPCQAPVVYSSHVGKLENGATDMQFSFKLLSVSK